MEAVTQSAPYWGPLVLGAVGQMAGFAAGFKLIQYRVDRIEKDHEKCKAERRNMETKVIDRLGHIEQDVSFIKGKLNGK